MMKKTLRALMPLLVLAGTLLATSAMATTCDELPQPPDLQKHLAAVVHVPGVEAPNGGRGHPAWLTLVDSSGIVCAVVTSLLNPGDVTTDMSGIGHRELSAHKANTSNAFSHGLIALASGNLYAPSLPGGTLFGTQLSTLDSHFINGTGVDATLFGTGKTDPMVGLRVGGYYPQPGGLALYNSNKQKVGAIGVSGDSFCTSHVIAWKVRERLADGTYSVANVPGGVANGTDALLQDFSSTVVDPLGFTYPKCTDNPTNDNDGGAIVGN